MKFFLTRMRIIFKLDDSPHHLAAAFALGVFIAFSPTIGLHTLSCLFVAWIFRLSKLVVFLAAFINNPWTIAPMYGFCLWFGVRITGTDVKTPVIAWNELTFRNAYEFLVPYLWPFVAGTLMVGFFAAIVSYAVVYWAVLRFRKSNAKRALFAGTEQ